MENSDFALFVFAAAPVTLLTLLSKSDVGKKVRTAGVRVFLYLLPLLLLLRHTLHHTVLYPAACKTFKRHKSLFRMILHEAPR